MSFKTNLKEQLSFAGIYVKELAALSGLKKQTIDSYLNRNNVMPSADAAVAIARVLGVSVEYLVTGEDTKVNTVLNVKEARLGAEIITKLNDKNRKMALAILNTMLKQEKE